MRKQRRAKELKIMRVIRDLVINHSDPDTGKIDPSAAEWLVTLAETAQGIVLENEAFGVWDGKKQPRWYRNMSIEISIVENAEDDAE
jgi:hypothetical protein